MKRQSFRKCLGWGLPLALVIGVIAFGIARHSMADWRTASRESVGIAPDPEQHTEAIVQVYAARAYSWRGIFGVHSWIAVKPTDAVEFAVYEVMGWRVRYGQPAVRISNRPADGRWFDAVPDIIADVRGAGVDDVIRRIDVAAKAYPYMNEYTVWPGPNSNTFIAHVARAVPELKLDLPPTPIGKDYLPGGGIVAPTPSGTATPPPRRWCSCTTSPGSWSARRPSRAGSSATAPS